jgi:RND family efflux transporter MFP subunit
MRHLPFLALIALAACSGGEPAAAPAPSALVSLAPAQPAPIRSTIRIYGTADAGAEGTVTLTAPEEAVVMAVGAPVGSAVTRGQVVAQLAPGPTSRLDLARAATDARAAQLAYARAQRLRADGLVGNAEVEAARAAAQAAGATQASLSQRAGGLVLRSPVAGHVQAVSASLGSLVAAGTPVVTIVGAGGLRGRFGVDPTLARQISRGTTVTITPSSGGASFGVPIVSVDPGVDPVTRLASVFVRLPAGAGFGAGEPLTGDLSLSSSGAAITVPYPALLDEGGQPYVYVVAGGKAVRRNVAVGPNDGQRVAILSGLRNGEQVVVAGGTALADGMQVRTR